MGWRRYIQFQAAALKVAWRRIKSWFKRRSFDVALLFVTVTFAVLFFLIGDGSFQGALLSALPTAVIVTFVVIYELYASKYHLWVEQQNKIKTQAATIHGYDKTTHPIIDIHFENTSIFGPTISLPPGCVPQAPSFRGRNGGKAAIIRVLPKVRKGIARSCRGYLTRIEKVVDEERFPEDIGSALPLTWASTNSVEPITLNESREEYLNVLLDFQSLYGMIICTDREDTWRWHDKDIYKGIYRLHIHVEQDGTPSPPIYLIVDWNGNWADTRVISESPRIDQSL